MRISDWSSDVCSSDLRQLPPRALGDLFQGGLGANAVGTGRDDTDIDHVADLEPRRDDMHRLEPRRLADELPFELALPFEEQARGAADGRGVERLLLLVEQSLQPLEAVVHFGFVDLIFHRRGRGAGRARLYEE